MTRYLSQALGAVEPGFSHRLEQLEHASGGPSADIRLTTENMQKLRHKIAQLGLDPQDTTGPELFAALQSRLAQDEAQVRSALGITDGDDANTTLARVATFANKIYGAQTCFALKTSVARKLLKQKPPRAAMKHLGYRSLESFLKHEQPAAIFAAAAICESAAWHRTFREQYTKLTALDFEERSMQLVFVQSKRWQTLAADFVPTAKHNLMLFGELGSVVILPMSERVDGLALMTTLLVLHTLNAARVQSSFAKLHQVNPSFGAAVKQASSGEPLASAELAGQPVPWRMVHRYLATQDSSSQSTIFEPHLSADDLTWRHPEDILAGIEPALRFWQDTQSLCLIHDDGQPVSLNIMDVALAYCNHLSFGERIVHYVRDNLWHELMLRYLKHERVEQMVLRQIGDDLTGQPSALATAEALA